MEYTSNAYVFILQLHNREFCDLFDGDKIVIKFSM